MRKPHKNAALIKAWADGAKIQWYDSSPREHRWKDCPEYFDWGATCEFRIKPEPKPDYVYFATFDTAEGQKVLDSSITSWKSAMDSLRLTFDGETGKLKSAEVI